MCWSTKAGLTVLAMMLLVGGGAVPGAHAFDLESVARQAAELAAEPYRDRQPRVPDWMLVGSMTYDQWRDIRFRPDHALWRDKNLPFQIQLFHPGLYYDRTVRVNVVDETGVHPVPFAPDRFDYGKNDFAGRIPADIGYAGLRVHYAMKTPAYLDEVIVFLGASYFRAIGRDNVWGLSARGLAIDTVEPSGEEFPSFTDFWLVEPLPDATRLVLYALLDSRSMTGAYRFEVSPGVQTIVAVDSRLYARRQVAKLGIAPLTSMFFFGENTTRHFDDFRPEVHDSDGLLVHFESGEWLWRPLDNPPRVNVSSFNASNPRGFGLLQRDRDFASYQDIETRSELRPSAWVEPRGDWGPGHVELIEIPTTSELNDNIVAFWVPREPVTPGRPGHFAYTLTWNGDATRPPGGYVVSTRRDSGTLPNALRFIVDFDGAALRQVPSERPPQASVTAGPTMDIADVLDVHLVKHPITGGWRLAFQVRPRRNDPIELRAYLADGGNALTETWSYVVIQ